MASDVDICNLALSFIGDDANVSSISPPEGSRQAEHCARFFPIARDGLLQMQRWNFASKRVALAALTNVHDQWQYTYAVPADLMDAVDVIPSDAADDYAIAYWPSDQPAWLHNYSPVLAAGQYVPQKYSIEVDASGNTVVYTNIENALLRYQARVTDTAKFPPLFVTCLAWHLASMLCGPVLKGDAGATMAMNCIKQMALYLQQARNTDASQRNQRVEHIVGWMTGR